MRLQSLLDYDVYLRRTSSTSYPGSLKPNLLSSTNLRRNNAVSRAVWIPKFCAVKDGDDMLWLVKLGSGVATLKSSLHVLSRYLAYERMPLDSLIDRPDDDGTLL